MLDYDQLAADYAQHRQVHPEVLRDLMTAGKVTAASAVLEVGCGTGNYLVALAAQTGCAGQGIDPSAEMLARARTRDQRLTFQAGRAEQLNFSAAAFDLVYSVDVIHHVVDRAAYYREAYRTLKPGSQVCTVTDSPWIIRHRQPLSDYFPETVPVELARYPAIDDLRALMLAAGFANCHETLVEFTTNLTDLAPYRAKAFSSLHLIAEDAFQRGLARMEQALAAGPIPVVSRYLLLWGVKGGQSGS
ncbi:MAG: class I SAM-dependent methyltransferase [Thermomicrobiales bacterium]